MSGGNKKIELKDIQENIENLLKDKSPRLMDIFMIVGYENIYINEKIIKDIKRELEPKEQKDNEEENKNNIKLINQKGYGEYQCEELPTVLSSITSDLDSKEKKEYLFEIKDFQFYLEITFCTNPIVYFTNDKQNMPQEIIKTKDYIPTIVTNEGNNYSYSYMFYEEKQDGKITFFIPKFFFIVSKYQYYKIFHDICIDIYEIFKSPKVQIPLEVQIYNIVNQTPCPNDCKFQLCLFPYQEFNIQKLNSINFFKNVKWLTVDGISGYSQNQINLGLIFYLFNLETIIEIFLELCLFTSITFFSQEDEKLFFIISIFNTLLYPISDEESAIILNYLNYYNKELGKCNQNYYGIKLNEEEYNSIKTKFPKLKDRGPNFYVLLDEEEKQFLSTFGKKGYDADNDIHIKKLYDLLHGIIYEQEKTDTKIENIIKSAKKRLNKINKEIKDRKLCKNYYESSDEEIEVNIKIRNAFYKLNLDLSNFIYEYESQHEEELKFKKNIPSSKNLKYYDIDNTPVGAEENIRSLSVVDPETKNLDDLFYVQIENCHYNDILKNFCQSEQKDTTSNNLRLPRKIFASFLSNIYSNPKENREIDYFRIIDSIYCPKNPLKTINFNFLDFYKYYYHNLDEYFSQVINSKYVTCNSENVTKEMIKHYYKYNQIDLDPELIMKYLCILELMESDESTKNELKKIFKDDNLHVAKNETNNLEILNSIERFYFENNLLNYQEIIRLCLINYIILTIPQKNLVYFNKESSEGRTEKEKKTYNNFAYDLFDCIYLFKNKYIEMFISVAYRYFNNSNEKNFYFIQPYFDLYDHCVVKRKIFKTVEIFDLYNAFEKFVEKIQKKNKPKAVEHKNQKLINDSLDNEIYSFDNKKDEGEILSKINDPKYDGNIIDEKITMSCVYEPNELVCESIYSPKKLYNKIKKIMKDFYTKLEIKDNKKESMNEIGINLLYYFNLMKNEDELPMEACKYILLNLEK